MTTPVPSTLEAAIAAMLRQVPLPSLRSLQGPLQPMRRVEDVLLGYAANPALEARLYVPHEVLSPTPLVVFFHGGGWARGDLDLYDQPCRAMAHASGCVFLSVAYRLAPEHRYPAALDDCHAATVAAAARAPQWSCDPARLVVAGDSAGGNLAAAVCLRASDSGSVAIAHQLLIYPPLDARMASQSYVDRAHAPLLTTAAVADAFANYAGALTGKDDPGLSPLRADSLAGLPTATLITAEIDPVRDDAMHYARRLHQAGIDAAHTCIAGVPHMALHMGGISAACAGIPVHAGLSLRARFTSLTSIQGNE